MPRGGKRKGAGRPRGKGPWMEATKPLRIPLSLFSAVTRFMETRGFQLPVYASRIPAGIPDHTDEHIEKMTDLNLLLLRNPQETFLLHVIGDSMTGAGIHDGDILTIDRKLEPRNGQIVVASIDGQSTVKTLRTNSKGVTLMPENKKYRPIKILPHNDFRILGVVTNVIRKVI